MLINLLRLLPPETAHDITIKLLKSNLVFKKNKKEEFRALTQTILGIDFLIWEIRQYIHLTHNMNWKLHMYMILPIIK